MQTHVSGNLCEIWSEFSPNVYKKKIACIRTEANDVEDAWRQAAAAIELSTKFRGSFHNIQVPHINNGFTRD